MDIEIGRCGVACAVCKYYKNVCLGCGDENQNETICVIYKCADKRNVKYCIQCNDFPCDLLSISKSFCPKVAKINLEQKLLETPRAFKDF